MDIEKDEEFELMLAEKRHGQLSSILTNILSELKKDSDAGEVAAINNLSSRIEKLVETVSDKGKPQDSTVNVSIDDQKFVTSISEMGKAIIDELCELKKALVNKSENTQWEFKVNRHKYSDLIDTIHATKK